MPKPGVGFSLPSGAVSYWTAGPPSNPSGQHVIDQAAHPFGGPVVDAEAFRRRYGRPDAARFYLDAEALFSLGSRALMMAWEHNVFGTKEGYNGNPTLEELHDFAATRGPAGAQDGTLRAWLALGDGSGSSSSGGTIRPPQNLKVTVEGGRVKLTWLLHDEADSFAVLDGETFLAILPASGKGPQHSGEVSLAPGTYRLRIAGRRGGVIGKPSAVKRLTVTEPAGGGADPLPTLGQIVQYTLPDGTPRAALVTSVGAGGVVDLSVLPAATTAVRYAGTPTPGSWSWPAKA